MSVNVHRRAVSLVLVCGFAAPRLATAQATKLYRIGWLSLGRPGTPSLFLDAFLEGMKDKGYVEGKNITIDARLAEGSAERADQMVLDLVSRKVDVIVTQGGAARSAFRLAGSTPVVMGYSGDPVEAKFVESLARPGGTRTGMSFLALELVSKRLEVLAQVLPAGALIAIIADPEHPGEQSELRASQAAAKELDLKISYYPVSNMQALDAAFRKISDTGVQAIVVFPDAFTLEQREKLAEFALSRRLPAVSGWSLYADAGFLMSYGPNLRTSYAHLATYVDKILRGSKPSDLPVELPTSVEFIVNAKTAKAIGIKLPQAMLLRADRVVE